MFLICVGHRWAASLWQPLHQLFPSSQQWTIISESSVHMIAVTNHVQMLPNQQQGFSHSQSVCTIILWCVARFRCSREIAMFVLSWIMCDAKLQNSWSCDCFVSMAMSHTHRKCHLPIMTSQWMFSAIQFHLCHINLGVHKFAPNLAINGDVGWISSSVRRKSEMLRYWNRLIHMDSKRLTKKVFHWDFNRRRTSGNWNSDIYKVFSSLNKLDIYENM